MNRWFHNKWLAAIISALIFSILFYCVVASTIYSGENGFVLYTLSGSFGGAPSSYLHYNHLMHPFLSVPITSLFKAFSGLNWYTASMITTNVFSITILYRCFLKSIRAFESLLLLTTILFVFGNSLLRNLEFSFCSMMLAVASCVWFLSNALNRRSVINWQFVICLVLASLWRMHVIVPIVCLFSLFVLPLGKKVIKSWSTSLLVAVALILLANALHRQIYTAIDPNWPSEENFRSSVYSVVNGQNILNSNEGQTLKLEKYLLKSGLYIDKQYLSAEKLKSNSTKIPKFSVFANPNNLISLKWLFINNKIYIACFILVSLLAIHLKLTWRLILTSLFLVIAGYILLRIFAKVPGYFLPSTLLALTTAIAWHCARNFGELNESWKRIASGFMLLLLVWLGIRIYSDNKAIEERNQTFASLQQYLQSNREKLFIVIPNNFIQHFDPFTNPGDQRLENYLDSEFWLNETAEETLQKFGVTTLLELPSKSNVFFVGDDPLPILEYYKTVLRLPVKIVDSITRSGIPMFRIAIDQSVVLNN